MPGAGWGLVGAPALGVAGLRAAPKEEAGVSAAEATYGHSLVLPSQLQPPPCAPQALPEKVDIPSRVRPATEAEKVKEVGIQEASHVYVRVGAVTGRLDATYCGPYCVMVRERKKLLLEVGATHSGTKYSYFEELGL